MTAQEMVDALRADGSCERMIVNLINDASRLRLAKKECMRVLVKLQKHYIDNGMQGAEPEFKLLRDAIEKLSHGDLRIHALSELAAYDQELGI